MQKNNYWESLSKKIENPSETYNKRSDMSVHDFEYLKSYISKDTDMMDFSCGTGQLTNKLIPEVNSIVAVETFEGFSKYVKDESNVLLINADIKTFKIRKKFDLIIIIGTTQFFNTAETLQMYKNCFDMLKDNGIMITRTHCGLEKTKTINSWSDELQAEYFAEYKHKEIEVSLYKKAGFGEITVDDNVHPSHNVWDDTKHFYFICKK